MHTPLPPFAAYSGSRQPKIVIVGEAWGSSELEARKPFVGESGKEFFRMMGEAWPELRDAQYDLSIEDQRYDIAWSRPRESWLNAHQIGMTNVLALRPPGNKIAELCGTKKEMPSDYDFPPIELGKYLLPEFLPELARLRTELLELRPNLVLAAGAKACWALLGATNIGSIRGGITQESLTGLGLKLLPTYHPAGIMRQWSWRPIGVSDLMKAKREAEYPEIRRPERWILVDPTLEEIHDWIGKHIGANSPRWIAADTETKGGQITMISFATDRGNGLVIPFLDEAKPGWSYWESPSDEKHAMELAEQILLHPAPKIWQNGLYDLQYLSRAGLRVENCVEDTMLLHHSLLPEMNKGLGFLGSIYTSEPSWKLMRTIKADTEKRDE